METLSISSAASRGFSWTRSTRVSSLSSRCSMLTISSTRSARSLLTSSRSANYYKFQGRARCNRLKVRAEMFGQLTTGFETAWKKLQGAGKLHREFKYPSGHISCIKFHPHEFLFRTGLADRTVKFWNMELSEIIGYAQSVREMSVSGPLTQTSEPFSLISL